MPTVEFVKRDYQVVTPFEMREAALSEGYKEIGVYRFCWVLENKKIPATMSNTNGFQDDKYSILLVPYTGKIADYPNVVKDFLRAFAGARKKSVQQTWSDVTGRNINVSISPGEDYRVDLCADSGIRAKNPSWAREVLGT